MLCSRGSHISRLRIRAFLLAFRGTGSEDFRRWMIAALSGPPEANWRWAVSIASAFLNRPTVFGGRPRFRMQSMALAAENHLVAQFLDLARRTEM
jgi:hypothetical protein